MRKFIAVESGIIGRWIVGLTEDGKNITYCNHTISCLEHASCDMVIRMLETVYRLGREDKAREIKRALNED